mmetsp:Transcript_14115/g.10172  ORF Transcript_14115/g.10172 Transcript_14115/m.10172 type:complete len:92 (+) Transcript_14115:1973-2248(+)|eukprot:CAMPEP_0202979750 /NCGR_PEP_ID=MMETSP1396-20130829/85822_1 /ASSEMBLY_ACC=CAM_ASM_000872 /TAXON_ID= /ORGANISM="Pseudokeronopsis sp., Strain Brazil" /LENGTH=91 /DNA_ID=CAMNT_0049719333 /DNA_START=2124 /DNA_END=2399 /DNA_ORIENTATION=+
MGAFNQENTIYQEILVDIFPNLAAIDNLQILEKAVKALPECYLILQGSQAMRVLDLVHDYNQLKAIIIFAFDKKKYVDLQQKFPKIKNICT